MSHTIFNLTRENDLVMEEGKITAEAYLHLMEASFNRSFSKNWFTWFNYGCPIGESRIYAAREGDQLAASVCFLPLQIIYEARQVPGSVYVNAMTHPQYQKRKLNVRLLEYAVSDAANSGDQISITFPTTERFSQRGMLRTGWKEYTDLYYYQLPRIPTRRNQTLTRVQRLTEDVESVLESYHSKLKFGLRKDRAFLNWRLTDRPDKQYEIYLSGSKSTPDGVVIIKHYHERDVHKTHVMELITPDPSRVENILESVETLAAESGSTILNLWSSAGDIIRSRIENYGFRITDTKNILMVQEYNPEMSLENTRNCVHFSLADNDVY